MVKRAFAAVAACVFGFSMAAAGEVNGTIKNVNKASLTLTVDGKDKVFSVGKDVSVVSVATKGKKKKPVETPISDGLTGIKGGANATVATEISGGKEVVTSIKITGGDAAKPAKKKKKKSPATSLISTDTANDSSEFALGDKSDKGKKKAAKGKKDKKKAKKDKKKAGKNKSKKGKKK